MVRLEHPEEQDLLDPLGSPVVRVEPVLEDQLVPSVNREHQEQLDCPVPQVLLDQLEHLGLPDHQGHLDLLGLLVVLAPLVRLGHQELLGWDHKVLLANRDFLVHLGL